MSFSLMVPRACEEIKEALMPPSQREETQDAAKSEAAAGGGQRGSFPHRELFVHLWRETLAGKDLLAPVAESDSPRFQGESI